MASVTTLPPVESALETFVLHVKAQMPGAIAKRGIQEFGVPQQGDVAEFSIVLSSKPDWQYIVPKEVDRNDQSAILSDVTWKVAQVTFSGPYARRLGQKVLYVTESAVFRLTAEGVRLEELASGVDLERDVLPQMGFRPVMADPVRTMAPELFSAGPLPRSLFQRYSS